MTLWSFESGQLKTQDIFACIIHNAIIIYIVIPFLSAQNTYDWQELAYDWTLSDNPHTLSDLPNVLWYVSPCDLHVYSWIYL